MAAPSRSIPQAFDGLAPRGTISPVRGHHSSDADDDNRAVLPRVGVLLNSSPKRILNLNVSEPFENSIAALHLATTEWFSGCGRPIHADALDRPVDLAPAIIETSDTNWAANTTLDVEALCANRGNKTIVRIGKDGTGVAIRRVRLAGGYRLGGLRLNGAPVPRMERGLGLAVTGHLPGAGAGLELARFRKPCLTQARLGLPFRFGFNQRQPQSDLAVGSVIRQLIGSIVGLPRGFGEVQIASHRLGSLAFRQ